MIAGTAPTAPFPWNEADEMLTLLIKRAAELAHCCPGTQEEKEFDFLAHAIEAYEVKRWPASPRRPGLHRTR